RILGTKTETATNEQALDFVAVRHEMLAGIERIAGSGGIRDVFGEADEAAGGALSWLRSSTSTRRAAERRPRSLHSFPRPFCRRYTCTQSWSRSSWPVR